MGIINYPSYTSYWSRQLRSPKIADAMPEKLFCTLLTIDEIDSGDKLAKIRPIIDAVTQQCHKVEPEEYNAVDEQILPSKTKFSKIRLLHIH